MRIHSDTLSAMHIINAANSIKGVHVNTISKHGSRSRVASFDIFLNGHSISSGQWGNADGKTASWDDWGMVLANLYAADPDMLTRAYADAYDFDLITMGRFGAAYCPEDVEYDDGLFQPSTPEPIHHRHRWEWQGESITNERRIFRCKGTRAIACTAGISLPRIERS